MPASCAYQLIIVAQQGTDGSNSLFNILTMVILLAVFIISNIAQAKKTQKNPRGVPQQRGDQPPPPGDYASDQEMEHTLDLPKREKPRPAAYAPGGFGGRLFEASYLSNRIRGQTRFPPALCGRRLRNSTYHQQRARRPRRTKDSLCSSGLDRRGSRWRELFWLS